MTSTRDTADAAFVRQLAELAPRAGDTPDAFSPLFSAWNAAVQRGSFSGLARTRPADRRDRFLTLLAIYDLATAPLDQVGEAARFVSDPAVAALKQSLEAAWLDELEQLTLPDGLPEPAAPAMRALAARNRLPAVYKWLASTASYEELVHFLAVEGGPDSGFDDLVAICQVGLEGRPKMELAQNYWDEMGNGSLDDVHTTLHERMASALDMPHLPRESLPVEALERSALGGLLATNRWLQPEMIGALGLIELQAGPRCRLVLQAFDRVRAPADAYPFYEVHAEVDPRHGKDWLDNVIEPLDEERPEWSARMVRGAWWRAVTNAGLFDMLGERVTDARAA